MGCRPPPSERITTVAAFLKIEESVGQPPL